MSTPSPSRPVLALLTLYTETPLHVGAPEGLGAVDLPIARERITRLPHVPGSGLRGALREAFAEAEEREPPPRQEAGALRPSERRDSDTVRIFGPPPPRPPGMDDGRAKAEDKEDKDDGRAKPSDFAGSLAVHDARLLLLPLRSVRGGWAWATSPMVLLRLNRDRELVGLPALPVPDPDRGAACVTGSCGLLSEGHVLLEDQPFVALTAPGTDALAEALTSLLPRHAIYEPFRRRLPRQLVVLRDGDFTDLAQRCTEVRTRVRIDPESRTVADGALWTEESLPAESLLWSVICVESSRDPKSSRKAEDQAEALRRRLGLTDDDGAPVARLRLGGDVSTGSGLVAMAWTGGEVSR